MKLALRSSIGCQYTLEQKVPLIACSAGNVIDQAHQAANKGAHSKASSGTSGTDSDALPARLPRIVQSYKTDYPGKAAWLNL